MGLLLARRWQQQQEPEITVEYRAAALLEKSFRNDATDGQAGEGNVYLTVSRA